MEVDFEELKKQLKEELIESGQYIRFEAIVKDGISSPYINIDFKGKVNSKDMGYLINALTITLKELKKLDPMAYKLSKKLKVTAKRSYLYDKKGKTTEL